MLLQEEITSKDPKVNLKVASEVNNKVVSEANLKAVWVEIPPQVMHHHSITQLKQDLEWYKR